MKKIVLLLSIISLVIGIYGCQLENESKKVNEAYVVIDINPSIEIITDENGLVTSVNPLNDDAQILLLDTDIEGITLEEAVNQIMQLALDMGYLQEELENAILVTVASDGDEEAIEDVIESEVEKFINDKKMKLEVIKSSFSATEEMEAEAEALGVSIGKYKLATYVSVINNIPIEETAQMSVRELNQFVRDAHEEVKAFYKNELKNKYFEIKDQMKVKYFKQVSDLIYQELTNLSNEEFTTLFNNTNFEEVKVLYKDYIDEVAALLSDENTNNENNEDSEENENQELEELKALKEELENNIKDLILQFKDIKGKNKQEIVGQLKVIRKQLSEINSTIHKLTNSSFKNRKQFYYNFKSKQFETLEKFDLFFVYRDIRKKYVDEFRKLNIDFDQFEQYFINLLQEEINAIDEELENELDIVIENFKEEGKMVKAYFQEERNILSEIRK